MDAVNVRLDMALANRDSPSYRSSRIETMRVSALKALGECAPPSNDAQPRSRQIIAVCTVRI